MRQAARWLAPAAVVALAGLTVLVAVARPGAGVAAATGTGGTLTVTGQSTLTVPPTEAQITVGIQLVTSTAGEAMAQDSRVMNAIVAALEKAGVPKSDLQTENYNLYPNQNNPSGNQAPRITGYTISDQLQVTTTDLPSVGTLIDVAVKAGANQVNGVNFTVANPNALLVRANDSALAQAHAQAAALAAAAGEHLGTLVSLSVNQNPGPGPIFTAAASAVHGPAILPPQSLAISSSVTAVYRLVP